MLCDIKKPKRIPGLARGVVMMINGQAITKADIIANKRRRQAQWLRKVRASTAQVIRPAFVWTFFNPYFPYAGWHLYIHTSRKSWWIREQSQETIILKAMAIYPCGYLPLRNLFTAWKAKFAATYPKVTPVRAQDQGMALARAVVSPNGYVLCDVLEW